MSNPNRREQILDLLTQEFRDDGHTVITEEGDVYAAVLVQRGPVTLQAAKFNLSTLANQIDRSLP
ncbi:MAG: hypothetical protein K0M49_16875 [Arenimonas sp.]|nr:hypothetical protein [Rhizobium sp.]MBW8447297.1 hypothetical protein [Arenimonas sp.]